MKQLFKAFILVVFSVAILSCGNKKSVDIAGQWKGELQVPGVKLNLIFDIESVNDTLKATLYSIDQSKVGMPSSYVEFNGDTLKIDIASAQISFKGKLTDNETITGLFTQRGAAFPLSLTKLTEDGLSAKHADDVESDLYTSTEVKFENKQANISLAGTLTVPNGKTNCAAVVLVTGSGAQNRDEELAGHKPFKRIANYLSNNGIVVLRYDDRGVESSGGDFALATTADFLTDALAAVDFLKTSNYNIDTSKIGIIGHSEGGQIAIMAAAQSPKVNFIISLAGPVMKGEDLILLQAEKIARVGGLNEKAIAAARKINAAVYGIINKQSDNKKAEAEVETLIQGLEMTAAEKEALAKQISTLTSPWFRQFLMNNAGANLPQIKCPALLLFGEKDLQVPAVENEAEFHKTITNNKPGNITLTTVAGVNHLFQNAITGSPNEYTNAENKTMNNETLVVMYNWLKDRVVDK